MVEQDFYIPTDRYLYAQITHSFKRDKFGRVFFNIRYPDNTTDGIYLARGDITTNDFLWDIVEEEEFHSDLAQIDGAIITPESLTPNSSPEHLQPLQLVSCPSPEWDHSPERLMEDNAFLWEVEPLRALTAQDILHGDSQDDQQPGQVSGEEAIKSPLGTFRRQPVFRRKRTPNSGFSANLLPHPITMRNIQMSQANNLNVILNPHSPIIPELVQLDMSLQLDHVLPHEDQSPVILRGPEKLIE